MPRFCTQCGSQVSDTNAFCSNCGAPMPADNQSAGVDLNKQNAPIPDNTQQFAQQNIPQQQGLGQAQNNFAQQPQQPFMQGQNGQQGFGQPQFAGQPGQPGKAGFNPAAAIKKIPPKYLKFGGIGLAALVVVIILICVLTGSSFEDPFKNYQKALEKGDAKAYSKAYFDSDDILGMGDSDADKREDLIEMRADFIERYGADAKVSYEIVDKKAASKSKITQYNAALKVLGGKDYQIKEAYDVTVIFTYKGSEDTDTDKESVTVIKMKDGWKFMDESPRAIYY